MAKRQVNLEFALGTTCSDENGKRVMWCSRSETELFVHWIESDGIERKETFPETPKGIRAFDKFINKAIAKTMFSDLGDSDSDDPYDGIEQIPLETDQMMHIASYFGMGYSRTETTENVELFLSQEKAFDEFWDSLKRERKLRKGKNVDS